MSKRIGTAIRCEEQRTSYLNQEYAKLISVLQQHDIETTDPCRSKSNINSPHFDILLLFFCSASGIFDAK